MSGAPFIHSTLRFMDQDLDKHLYVEDKAAIDAYLESHPNMIVLSVAEDKPYQSHLDAYVRISYREPKTKNIKHVTVHTKELAHGDICDYVGDCMQMKGVVSDLSRMSGGKKYRKRATKKSATRRKKASKSKSKSKSKSHRK